jgi:hypothetical protein
LAAVTESAANAVAMANILKRPMTDLPFDAEANRHSERHTPAANMTTMPQSG